MILSVDSLSIGYPGSGVPVCSGVSFDIPEGECILLCGANGSGKSTLMKTIAGILPPLSGKVNRFSGESVMIPTRIPKVKGFTLEEFMRTGFYRKSSWSGRLGNREKENILLSAEEIGITGLLSRDISTLSDGEFQKGCIASALARMKGEGGLLLLDEPTAFLDVDSRASVLESLRRLSMAEGLSVLYSSHDIHDAAKVSDRIFALKDGAFKDSALQGNSPKGTLAWAFSSLGLE